LISWGLEHLYCGPLSWLLPPGSRASSPASKATFATSEMQSQKLLLFMSDESNSHLQLAAQHQHPEFHFYKSEEIQLLLRSADELEAIDRCAINEFAPWFL
jgi:hypothetical protein